MPVIVYLPHHFSRAIRCVDSFLCVYVCVRFRECAFVRVGAKKSKRETEKNAYVRMYVFTLYTVYDCVSMHAFVYA